MSVVLSQTFQRGAIRAAAFLSAFTLSNSAVIQAGTPQEASVQSHKMSELKIAATIRIGKVVDWVAVTSNGVWVGSKKPNSVKRVDPNTNEVTAVGIPGEPCAGLAADSESLWVPLCGAVPKLAKIDLKTRVLAHVFGVGPAAPEGGIAIDAGSIWLITDKQGSLARIDSSSGSILQTIHVAPGSFNPVFSDGRIWVTRAAGSEVTSVDATTGKVLEHIAIGNGRHPRFVAAGAGAVWTLNQGDGTLTRIDVAGQRSVLTLQLHTPGAGGDITYAEGRIWTTMMKTPISVVDAAKSVILCQWKGAGGDAIGVGYGSLWLTNYTAGTVSRIAISELPEDCRPQG